MTREEFEAYLINLFPNMIISDVRKVVDNIFTYYYSVSEEIDILATYISDWDHIDSEGDTQNFQSAVVKITTADSEGYQTISQFDLPMFKVELTQDFLENKLQDIYDILNN